MGQFNCPACGQPITADESPPTKVVPCPRCGLQMLVPPPPPDEGPRVAGPAPPPELERKVLAAVTDRPLSLDAVAAAVGWPPDVTLEELLIALCQSGKLERAVGGFRKPD